MECKRIIRYILWIFIVECLGGCVTTQKEASLDIHLSKLEARVAQVHRTEADEWGAYREVFAACILDYYRRYGDLNELNQPIVAHRLAERKSKVIDYGLVAEMLEGLSRNNPSPEQLLYSTILERYSRATAAGRNQTQEFLKDWGMLDVNAPNGVRKGVNP